MSAAEGLAAISRWIDAHPANVGIDPEALLWRRTMKVASEVGEVQEALGGMVGENPRKGVTHTREDLIGELLDVAIAALCAVEHLNGNNASAMDELTAKIAAVRGRALGAMAAWAASPPPIHGPITHGPEGTSIRSGDTVYVVHGEVLGWADDLDDDTLTGSHVIPEALAVLKHRLIERQGGRTVTDRPQA